MLNHFRKMVMDYPYRAYVECTVSIPHSHDKNLILSSNAELNNYTNSTIYVSAENMKKMLSDHVTYSEYTCICKPITVTIMGQTIHVTASIALANSEEMTNNIILGNNVWRELEKYHPDKIYEIVDKCHEERKLRLTD